jgi:hypothetical protein
MPHAKTSGLPSSAASDSAGIGSCRAFARALAVIDFFRQPNLARTAYVALGVPSAEHVEDHAVAVPEPLEVGEPVAKLNS